MNVGHFSHGHFGHGKCQGGRFGQNHKLWVGGRLMCDAFSIYLLTCFIVMFYEKML